MNCCASTLAIIPCKNRCIIDCGIDNKDIDNKDIDNKDIDNKDIYSRDYIFGFLKNNMKLFSNLTDEQLYILVDLFVITNFEEQNVIINENDESINFYIIIDGEVYASSLNDKNNIYYLKLGDYFGENSLIPNNYYSRTITASDNVYCLTIDCELLKNNYKSIQSIFENIFIKSAFINIPSYYNVTDAIINKLFEYFTIKKYSKNEIIVNIGENWENLCIVMHGIITIYNNKKIGDISTHKWFGNLYKKQNNLQQKYNVKLIVY